ncbi:MAG: two-component system response regulator [Magnetococcales bacterium]|nr:two-component system response regulator [Magnetococcales bacterium]
MRDSKPKILIVDDAPENLQILVETLREIGAVIAAKNGAKALELAIGSSPPDLIILDVMMPGMDGFEVCLKLKANPATWAIPVLFITALQDEESEMRGLTVGGVDFITKPINPVLVRSRVRSQLELLRHKYRLEELVKERTRVLEQTQDVTIQVLAALAEARDPETGAHIVRTKHYVRLLAEQMQTQPRFAELRMPGMIDLLFKSAPLHDVGKVGVPDGILLKPGRLTVEEFTQMKLHTTLGANALKVALRTLGADAYLHVAAEIALSHHEKWDGSGYPHGLVGEAIPLSGRLMAIADVYDALISHRVYKPAMSHAQGVEIIVAGKGGHFDPDLVDGFMQVQEGFREIALRFADE